MLLALSGCSTDVDNPGASADVSGGKAVDFTLNTLDGGTVTLSEVLRTKRVVLDFWATWCPHCVTAIPELESFYKNNKRDIAVFGIDVQESPDKILGFKKRIEMSYPILLDTDGKVAASYNVRGIPTIVAIDKNGDVLYYGHSVRAMQEEME